jgi:hypothetical protein
VSVVSRVRMRKEDTMKTPVETPVKKRAVLKFGYNHERDCDSDLWGKGDVVMCSVNTLAELIEE